MFYHYAKTNKSGLQAMVDEALHNFQIEVNMRELNALREGTRTREEACLTTTYMKGVTPERFFAKCDADMEGRCFASMLLGHDEFAGWAEEVGLLPGSKGSKERQANLNIAFDTGRPSKDYQDERRSYGCDIYAMYEQRRSGQPARRVVVHHLSGLNARDALRMMSEDSVQNTAMALRERYLLFTSPICNPYELPPEHVQLPAQALNDQGRPLQDNAGFQRDILPGAAPTMFEFMMRCWQFVGRSSNKVITFSIEAREKFRSVDAVNWRLAGFLQFINDRLSAELRQTQRILAILSVGHFALDIGFSRLPANASSETHAVQLVHVERACLMLALIMASNSVGLRNVEATALPAIARNADGAIPNRLLCSVIAPAFVKLLDGDGVTENDERAIRADAATLGVMRLTLLWPGCSRVSKGAVTRHLRAQVGVHEAWSAIGIEDVTRKSAWWATTVAARLKGLGLGDIAKHNDGMGYIKPTRAELATEAVQQALRDNFQLTPQEVLATLGVDVDNVNQREEPLPQVRRLGDADAAVQAHRAGML